MRESFAALLGKDPRFYVENYSIGATPSVVLLDFLVMCLAENFDYIIVETAVMDVIQGRPGIYPTHCAKRGLQLFLHKVTFSLHAKIIFLILPTLFALLEPGFDAVEDMYLSLCAQFGVPVLNLYNIIRNSLGNYDQDVIKRISAHAPVVAEAFDVPRRLAHEIAWRQLKSQTVVSNALAFHAFVDTAHINRTIHSLIYHIMAEWIARLGTPVKATGAAHGINQLTAQIPSPTIGCSEIKRESSLLGRGMICLKEGDQAKINVPDTHLLLGFMVNRARTSGYIRIAAGNDETIIDCSFRPVPPDWIAMIIPIIDNTLGGDLAISVTKERPNRGQLTRVPESADYSIGVAEIGEFIIVSREYYNSDFSGIVVDPSRHGGFAQIENAEWAQNLVAGAEANVDRMLGGREYSHKYIFPEISGYIRDLLKTDLSKFDLAGRARLLFLLGEFDSALELLDEPVAESVDTGQFAKMAAALRAFIDASRL